MSTLFVMLPTRIEPVDRTRPRGDGLYGLRGWKILATRASDTPSAEGRALAAIVGV